MNHRDCVRLVLGLLLLPAVAFGQSSIPTAVKTAPSLDAAQEELINAFVRANVAKLLDKTPDAVKQAREALSEGGRAGMSEVSPAYAGKYAATLDAEVQVLLDKTKEIRPRLNAAIVVARVAETTRSNALEPVTLKLLDDSQPYCLRLWGVKAAKALLPGQLKEGNHQKLLDRVLASVKQFPTGPMTHDAYEAMAPRGADRKAVVQVFDPLMAMVRTRLEQYRNGVPEDPIADFIPFNFLVQSGVWNTALTAAQRAQAMQAMVDVMTFSAVRGDELGIKMRDQLSSNVETLCNAIWVAANLMGEKTLAAKAQESAKVAAVANARLAEVVRGVVAEIKKVKEFAQVELPTVPATSATSKAS